MLRINCIVFEIIFKIVKIKVNIILLLLEVKCCLNVGNLPKASYFDILAKFE